MANVPNALNENYYFSNISATPTAFNLRGGLYAVMVNATGSGTITLQRLSLDASTYVTVLTAITATASYATVSLPPGTYRVAIATFTAVYVEIIGIASA
jgi:hypothetical protein